MLPTLPSSCRPGEIYVLRESGREVSYMCAESNHWIRNNDADVIAAMWVIAVLVIISAPFLWRAAKPCR